MPTHPGRWAEHRFLVRKRPPKTGFHLEVFQDPIGDRSKGSFPSFGGCSICLDTVRILE